MIAIIIINQISQYFSLLRKIKLGLKKRDGVDSERIQKFDEIIKAFQSGFYQVIYLSSMDIE
jgi:hypothetical protein